MQTKLGQHTFDPARTTAIENFEEIGGRTTRTVRLQGVLEHLESRAALEAALDAVLAAAPASGQTPLSLRLGRRLLVRRTGFRREVMREPLVGAFRLDLEAVQPREEAETLSEDTWYFASSGATHLFHTSGNTPAAPVLALTASGTVIEPALSDGTRILQYDGVLEHGDVLVVDGPERRVTKNGADVTPYTTGLFLRIAPPETLFTYTDAPDSSHAGVIEASWRDLWW